MLTLHFLGWFAAPLFVILAGTGAAIMSESKRPASDYVKRGLMIIVCGYILNFITPNWFKPGSWYILHTIGLSIIIAPVLLKLKNIFLIIIIFFLLLIPPLLQTWLNTSLLPGNTDMNNISLPGGLVRIAFAEGHFPVFPWLGFFTSGIISRRMIIQNREQILLYASITLTGSGIFLGSLYNHGYFFATGGKLFRIFVPLQHFYPPLPVFIIFIMGISLLLFYFFSKNNNLLSRKFFSPLNALGRSSLSWFVIHIFLFNQMAWFCGLYKVFSYIETLIIIIISVIIMLYSSKRWEKNDFKYGLEWAIKRFTL
jgi:uncharacterized membrane protein